MLILHKDHFRSNASDNPRLHNHNLLLHDLPLPLDPVHDHLHDHLHHRLWPLLLLYDHLHHRLWPLHRV